MLLYRKGIEQPAKRLAAAQGDPGRDRETCGTRQEGWTLTHPVAWPAPWFRRCTSQKQGRRCQQSHCQAEHHASHRSRWLPWLSPSSLRGLERDGKRQPEAESNRAFLRWVLLGSWKSRDGGAEPRSFIFLGHSRSQAGPGAFKIQLCLQGSNSYLDSEGGRRMNTHTPHPPPRTTRALRAHLVILQPLPARCGMLIDSEPLFGLFNSFCANDSKTGTRVKFWARRHGLVGKAGTRSHRSWGGCDLCPQCPSVPPDAPHSIQPPPAPGGNLSPCPFVAIKRKKDLSRCQTQQALISPSPCYFLMTLAQTAPHPPLLSQSYIAQAATCLFYHRYWKGSAQRPQMPGSSAQCSLQTPGTSPGPGDTSSHSSGTSPNPPRAAQWL